MRDLTLEELASVLDNSKIRGDELRAACPAHGGSGPNLSVTYKDGKLLATCHSKHCAFEEIAAAIRERLGEPEERADVTFGGKNKPKVNGKRKPKIQGRQTWELRDAAGQLVARHVREDLPNGDKRVRWKMPDGTWKLDRATSELPLYGAERAAKAPAGACIVVTEGEKAADALRAVCETHKAPLVIVGTVTGASGTPGSGSLEALRGRTVVLWPDADGPGFEHMGRIAEALVGVAAEIRWFEWPEAPEKGDAADHPGTRDAAAFVRSGLLHELLTTERWSRPPAIEGRMLVGQAIEKGIEPPEELLPDILLSAKAHNIYAPGGVGKTWVLVWLATQLVKRGKRVVVFDLENGLRTYAERFEEMGADPKALDDLLFYYPFPMLNREAYERMLDEDKPDVVMFDSWIGFLAADGRDENVSNDISAWADAYSKPALRRGIAVVVLDHVPHEHERERGSTRKRDEMDVVWKLIKLGDFDRDRTAELTMSLQKDREGWLPFKVGWRVGGDPATGRFVMERDDALAHTDVSFLTPRDKIALEALESFGEDGARAGEWLEEIRQRGEEVSRRALYRIRDSLMEKEKILELETGTSHGGTANVRYVCAQPESAAKGGKTDVVVRSSAQPSAQLGEEEPTGSETVVRGCAQGGAQPKTPANPDKTEEVVHPPAQPSAQQEDRGAPGVVRVVHPLKGGGTSQRTTPSEASSASDEEKADETEPQDLGARLRRIRDEMRRQRGDS